MEFLFILLIVFIVCPPLGAALGLFVGVVGLFATPFILYAAYRSYKSMYHDNDDNDKW